ncbi:uncharacterized protein Dwil_GK11899 [Drosophila willistoni]|uniref:Uncharacterized protein n=1 Tax=Drosophila willistoni TaxID=7260 RepID=B4N4B6_DROWI|nr:uncharacterized protein LOC6645298 [Drosophila willistoni]EDW78990.1 uncharacterized protein Dwil_GK11899 [Drosophila willistoni]
MKKRRITSSWRGRGQQHSAGVPIAAGATCFRVTCAALARVWHAPRLLFKDLLIVAIAVGLGMIATCSAVGYSYARFEGPVVGPEHLITSHDGTSDYVARPEYSFAYGVEDGKTRVLQNRKETRQGDEVRGVYSVVDPDGTLRVVKYTADDANGFQAEVITNGVATLHGHGNADEGNAGLLAVDQHVRHEIEHNNDAEEEDDEADTEEEGHNGQRHKSNNQYKVHEDQNEAEEEAGDNEEGGGDHEEYEGSSEEGYDDADAHQEQDSSEEY